MNKINIAIIGASGYTGCELLRLLLSHSEVKIAALIANQNANKDVSQIYPHFSGLDLPKMQHIDEVDFSKIDVAFCCLPHATSQEIIKKLVQQEKHLKIIDLSADFRLEDGEIYQQFYGQAHQALDLQKDAVYGLSELNRAKIKEAKIIACPGCYPTSALLPLIPLLQENLINEAEIIIDSKTAISGAGRTAKTSSLFTEVNDSMKVYGVKNHRHVSEIEQEINKFTKQDAKVSFTPHLVPMNRGIISTIYVKGKYDAIKSKLTDYYQDEYFVKIVQNHPATKDVYGSNLAHIAVYEGRQENQAIIVCVIDNLVKGASGQAVQNMNIAFDLEENTGLEMIGIFP